MRWLVDCPAPDSKYQRSSASATVPSSRRVIVANHFDDLASVLYTPVHAEVSDGVAEVLDPGKISALRLIG